LFGEDLTQVQGDPKKPAADTELKDPVGKTDIGAHVDDGAEADDGEVD
jgi:hypothetical protein